MGRWDFKEESSTPSTPASGYSSIYPKSDGYWYYQNDAGLEVRFETSAGTPQDQIYYVGKHGSDSNTGRSLENAFLTFTEAITEVNAQSPSISNPFTIVCLDAGIYSESLTLLSYVQVFAPNATFLGNMVVNDYSSFTCNMLHVISGVGITKSSGSGTGIFATTILVLSNNTDGTLCTSGNLQINVGTGINSGTGYLFGGASTACIHVVFNELNLTSTGEAINFSSTGEFIGTGNLINGASGTAILASNGEVHLVVADIDCSVAVNVGSAGCVSLIASDLAGSVNVDPGGCYDATIAGQVPSHGSTHENGGADEISVADLSGLLADAQTPLSHDSTHEDGGADEISVAGLSGLLADAQTPLSHVSTHEVGGSDEYIPSVLESSAEGESSTTNGTWTQVFTWSPTLEVAKYLVFYYGEITSSSGSYRVHGRLQVDDSVDIADIAMEPEGTASNEYISMGGVYLFDCTSAGTHNFDFDIYSESGGGTAYLRKKRVVLLKAQI